MNKFLMTLTGLLALSEQMFAAEGDTISLDEKWLFKLARNEASVPRNSESTRFNDSQWGFQKVPGVWRVPTAWSKGDYVGIYRGWIKMQPEFGGRRIFLHLGFTTAAADVYVNGQKIGRTALDRAQTEFDITPYVKIGQRNLFVFRMPHYDEGEDAANTFGQSGITSTCYIYALQPGQELPAGPVIGKAKGKTRVASRYSFQLAEGFFDTPKTMQQDIDRMKELGFGAITYNKLSSDPDFIAYARSQQMDVVSDPPLTTAPLIDMQGNYTLEVYNLLPPTDYDFKKEIKDGERRASDGLPKARPRKRENRQMLTVWDDSYIVSFNKVTGLLAVYSLHGTMIFSGSGSLMPNAKMQLVSLNATKPSKSSGTKVTAVYDIEGGNPVTWVYNIASNGVLTLTAEGPHDILVSVSPKLSEVAYLAQGLKGDQILTDIKTYRPNVYWMKRSDSSGQGIEVIGTEPFTAVMTPEKHQLLVQHGVGDVTLNFLPVAQQDSAKK